MPLERKQSVRAAFEILPFRRKDVVSCDNDIALEHVLDGLKATRTPIYSPMEGIRMDVRSQLVLPGTDQWRGYNEKCLSAFLGDLRAV